MKRLLFITAMLFSLMAFADADQSHIVTGTGVGEYKMWIARPEYLEFEIKALVDKNAIEMCPGGAIRVSDFTFSETYDTAPMVTVTGSANFECF